MTGVTTKTLHDDIIALMADVRADLIRIEAKVDAKPSLLGMAAAVFILVFSMTGIITAAALVLR